MSNDAVTMRKVLEDVLRGESGWVELRWHRKSSRGIGVEDGRVASASARHEDGISGACGRRRNLRPFLVERRRYGEHQGGDPRRTRSPRSAAAGRRHMKLPVLPTEGLARGDFGAEGVADIARRPLEEKLAVARDAERAAKAASSAISSANAAYSEIHEAKAIVTSDGASASFELVRPEFRVTAVAMRDGIREVGTRTRGATGGWDCLFRGGSDTALAEAAAKTAVDLLRAPRPEGGRKTIILDPSIVGLLVHEAIGHTVEADFVAAGSVAAGNSGPGGLGSRHSLRLGRSEHQDGAGGTIPVDDEGVLAGRTCIIDRGVLRSYLHDRESAARAGVSPTGNARAFTFEDEPLIRMRNTYIEPGATAFDDIVATTDDGYLLEGPRNGQADATGEFMFGVERAWRIRNGRIVGLEKGVTVSGIAFDTLMSVDAVSREFRWDLGSGYCGKGQLMKVDAGGPYVRCHALLGSAS
jgi:TldD protein